jgi:eukaryotic-like serine/threonine-protein kinase
MAPEQATGGGVDERADVYALAAVTYHLLTGEVAHSGTIAELAHLEPPTPPSATVDVPSAVDDIVLQGLASDRADRWPDVHSFVRALQATSPNRAHTILVPSSDFGRRPTQDSSASRPGALLWLLCLGVFVACFAIALVVTQQLR